MIPDYLLLISSSPISQTSTAALSVSYTFGQNWGKFSKFLAKIAKFWKKTAKNSAIFNENFEIRERCKGVHCVDLGESFPTSIYLQNLPSIQPRTSPTKFVSSSSREFEFKFETVKFRTSYLQPNIPSTALKKEDPNKVTVRNHSQEA